ncbi:hypothetical protein PR048_012285 [Dryococelus australis]|uniref:Integrase catalytic domain-containing protein n=1 Tax=Dryococelus australis TaxID=614101 RepID=A0ABQ9HNX1_9NEOP|nr:hypothetical protein PR048_012285 [Dryococelus australis]
MNKEIAEFISICVTSLNFQCKHTCELLLLREIPKLTWHTVGTYMFHFKGKYYLLIVDYLSKYVELIPLKHQSSETTIEVLKSVFARFGIPEKVHSANGPQFISNLQVSGILGMLHLTHISHGRMGWWKGIYRQLNGLWLIRCMIKRICI